LAVGTTLEQGERELIRKTLASVNNNKTRAATVLGTTPKALHNKARRSRSKAAQIAGSRRVGSVQNLPESDLVTRSWLCPIGPSGRLATESARKNGRLRGDAPERGVARAMQKRNREEEAAMRWIEQLALFGPSGPVSSVWAQASPHPASSPGFAQQAAPDVIDDAGAGFLLVSAVILFLLIVGVGVKIYDLRQKRDHEAAAIQVSLSDALMDEPTLSRFPLTPRVRIPLWRGRPVMVEVAGSVPEHGLRQAAVDLVLRGALRMGKGCRVENRISVDQAMLRGAA
jgi:hypothetical protein